jgi:hypothetical protein
VRDFIMMARVIDTSVPICMAVAALVLGVVGMGLWIDWKWNWRKDRGEPGRARGFDVLPAPPAPTGQRPPEKVDGDGDA